MPTDTLSTESYQTKSITSEIGQAFEAFMENTASNEDMQLLANTVLIHALVSRDGDEVKGFELIDNFNAPNYRDEIVNVLRDYTETSVPVLRAYQGEHNPHFVITAGEQRDFLKQLAHSQRISNPLTALLNGDPTAEQLETIRDNLNISANFHSGAGSDRDLVNTFNLKFQPKQFIERAAVIRALQENPSATVLSVRGDITFAVRPGLAKEVLTQLSAERAQARGIGA